MAGRGAQTFKKRQKEQQRKERAEEKRLKRLQRSKDGPAPEQTDDDLALLGLLPDGSIPASSEDSPTPDAL